MIYSPLWLDRRQAICGMILLGGVLFADVLQPRAAEPKSEDLPEAREIIDKFIENVGGRDAILAVTSQHLKGTYSMPAQGITGEMEIFAAKPNKLLVKIELGAIGAVTSGFDGDLAWMDNAATGPMLIQGEQKTQLAAQADFYSVLHREEDFESITVTRKTQFADRECYEMKLVRKSGFESTEYFDAETFLQVGFVQQQESPLGSIKATNTLDEYKEFGEIRMPTRITQALGPVKQVMVIKSAEFNTVDPDVFTPPAKIKALDAN